jgi:hypothetical protein
VGELVAQNFATPIDFVDKFRAIITLGNCKKEGT